MGKYRYESSWTALQKEFPDYDFTKYVNETSKIWCLNNISNELAEANRLKLLELKIVDYTEKFKCHEELYEKFLKELEDKA